MVRDSYHPQLGNRYDELASGSAIVGLLRHDLVCKVPGQQEHVVRALLEEPLDQLRVAERLCASSGLSTVGRHEVSRWGREERLPGSFWLGWLSVVLEVPLPELEAGLARVAKPWRLVVVEDADHFFAGRLPKLQRAIVDYFATA